MLPLVVLLVSTVAAAERPVPDWRPLPAALAEAEARPALVYIRAA